MFFEVDLKTKIFIIFATWCEVMHFSISSYIYIPYKGKVSGFGACLSYLYGVYPSKQRLSFTLSMN